MKLKAGTRVKCISAPSSFVVKEGEYYTLDVDYDGSVYITLREFTKKQEFFANRFVYTQIELDFTDILNPRFVERQVKLDDR